MVTHIEFLCIFMFCSIIWFLTKTLKTRLASKSNKENNTNTYVTQQRDIDRYYDDKSTVPPELMQCDQLQRLRDVMLNYNGSKVMDHVDIQQILDDYLFLLQHYNDDQCFEFIHHQFDTFCNNKTCNILSRMYRNRKISGKLSILSCFKHDIMDKIHCYYQHSFDVGHRLTSRQNDRKTMNKTKMLYQMINSEKYHQFVPSNDNIPKKYCFGKPFGYKYDDDEDDPFYRIPAKNSIPVSPKYKTFKQELLNNEIAILYVEQFNSEYKKATIHFNSKYRKQNRFKLMRLEFILSLMIYCNYDYLQHEFSKTYRDNIVQHEEFYHLGKYL
eukprot:464945_1